MLRTAMAALAMVLAAPAVAGVHEASDTGFVVRHTVDVPADPAQTWRMLLSPSKWWSDEHSFSGNAANLSLDPRAGGCFCEILPNRVSPNAAPRGSVEHMRVVNIEEPRVLRMTGAIGPLQAGAGTGTLTVMLKPVRQGTRILWEYVYGGFVRGDVQAKASALDRVLAEQMRGLATRLGAGMPEAPKAPKVPVSEREDDDFAREMEAGIAASAPKPSPEPDVIPLPDQPPATRKNDQGFIGR